MNDARHEGDRPDQPADPSQARQPVMRRDVDPDAGALHDMGGNVGPAPDTAAGDRRNVDADASGSYAEPVSAPSPTDPNTLVAQDSLGLDDPLEDPLGGDSSPAPAPQADEYVGIDAERSGRGADGETDARVAQKEAETEYVPASSVGRDPRFSSEHAADTPGQADAERMESALREGGPLPDRASATRRSGGAAPDVEDGPGTSLT